MFRAAAQEQHCVNSGSAQHTALQMRACLAWADRLLKCLAAPIAGVNDVDADSGEAVATGVRESVLLHVVTSFAPGSHSREALKPGTIADEALEKLGSTGASHAVVTWH